MELVYLWVEDYKNIKKQGFNFSPRFNCKYDENTKELSIDENKDYISIFPENINITAIVGENGSGKSALILNFIMNNKGFFILNENDRLTIYFNHIIPETDLEKKQFKTNFYNNVLFYSINNTNLATSRSHLNVIVPEETNKLITEYYIKLQENTCNLFNFKPYFIYFKFRDTWIATNYEFQDKDITAVKLALNMDTNDDSEQIHHLLTVLRDLDDNYLIYLLSRFGEISNIFEHINLIDRLHPKEFILMVQYDEIQKVLDDCKLDYISELEFNLLKKHEHSFIKIKNLENLFGKEYLVLFFHKMVDDLEFDFKAENDATFSTLSDGEQVLYSFFANLVSFNKDEFILLLDEPDNALHPNWQKSFLNEIIKIINQMKLKVHLIITSHSPFILSDLPKENVIFLKNGKQVNVDIYTFGANIHTLLSHGFFMKDGLMGEFAKERINEAIKYLNQKSLTKAEIDYYENIISIIGEPILKRQLQKLLDSKKLNKIDDIDNKIKEMEYELEVLKKHQKTFVQEEIKDRAKRKYTKKKKDDKSK